MAVCSMAKSILPKGNSLNILLLGKTGHGKSATGNTILQQDVFTSDAGGKSVTTECAVSGNTIGGRQLTVVDTPGTMDTRTPYKAMLSLVTAICHLHNSIDAVIIVLNYSTRMTEEETACFEKLKILFGTEVLEFVVVVFTHGDNYEKVKKRKNDKRPFSKFLEENGGDYLIQFLKDCSNRYVLVDNFAEKREANKQHSNIIGVIDAMVKKNKRRRYRSSIVSDILQDHNMEINNDGAVEESDQETGVPEQAIKRAYDEMKKSGAECFPASSLLLLSSGSYIKMRDLKIGDTVVTFSDDLEECVSEVYLFGHSLDQCTASFLCLKTKNNLLKITEGHHIYTLTNGHMTTKAAKDVSVGNVLLTMNEGRCVPEEVTDIWQTEETGLYAPFTMSGSIVVDGVLASCYADIVRPRAAHPLLWPVRQLYKISPTTLAVISKTGTDGIPRWIRWCMDNVFKV